MTVQDMLKGKKKSLCSIAAGTNLFDAIKFMVDKGIGALLVMEKEKTVGIITERDFKKAILKGKTLNDTLVKEVMTPEASMIHIKPETTLEECMVLITGKRIRHLPIMEKGKFTGMISIGDVLKSALSEKDVLIDQLSGYIQGKYT